MEEVRRTWGVDDALLRKLRHKVTDKVYYFAVGKEGGRLVKEWNLIVPKNLEAVVAAG